MSDPAYAVFDNCVNDGTTPQTRTNANGISVTWQWSQKCNGAADENNGVDPRLAGIANLYTASGGETLTLTVPQPGTYYIGFATGNAVGNQCGGGNCPNFIFRDGSSGSQLFTVNPNNPGLGHFIDAANNNWMAAQWPSGNQQQLVTLTGTTLTVSMAASNAPNIAHIRITSAQPQPNFSISASPASLSVGQGNQATSTITTTISNGFNSAISLSAAGVPSGTTVSFNPSTIPAPGSGTSTMTITVGVSTPTGTYPITVTGNGGGIQQNTTVNLTVTAQQYDVGIDFRGTQNFASDPAYAVFDNCGNDGTTPQTRTNANGISVTWQWSQKCNMAVNEYNGVDPRLAGIANVYTASGGETLTLTVPQPGAYYIGFATGNALLNQCGGGNCPNFIFQDGASGTQLFTVSPNNPGLGHFIDAANNNWTAAQWPSGNQQQLVTLTGTTLTVSMAASNAPSIAHIRITSAQPQPNFTMSASPASLSIQQGNQGTSTITTTISNGFNSAISLSASGAPSGTTVSFNPSTIPAPGTGNSTMTITVGSSTPTGTYPIMVTGNGGGTQQTTTVTLTVTAAPNFTISASPASLSVQQGNQGTSTITTTISNGFNSAISLSASGAPSGTTVSFNPSTIPAPGSGSSTMTITVASSTPTGTYPITVTGNGGGIQQSTTVTLTVTAGPNYTISASPVSLSIQQGNQGTSTITTTISGGFNSAISLSASGAPSGTTVSFNPSTIPAPGSGSSTMTITVASSTPTGTYPIMVTGNGGGTQQTTTVTLTVTAAPNFTISASPVSLSIQQGNQGTSTITTTISGGFNNAISLSASGAPSGTTVSFNPSTIPAPGSGSSTMTITVASSTPTGTYPIMVTGNGGGTQQTTTVTLTVTAQQYNYDVGIDFRNTQNYVSDPAYAVFDNCGNDGTTPQTRTNANGQSITWQWSQNCNLALDRSNGVDPRLAGIANLYTASGGETLTITVPQPGTYYIGFATGDAMGNQCGGGYCSNFIFRDGTSGTQLFTVNPNNPGIGNFVDAANNNWTAAQWSSSNQAQQVTLTGKTLTVSTASPNSPNIAHIRMTYAQPQQNFSLLASPVSLSIVQGTQGTSTITTAVNGGFSNSISLSASGAPSGTTVSFNPSTIPAPGSGNSTMTITVASGTPTGTYPITVTGNGGGVQQNATVTLTVGAPFVVTVSPHVVTVPQGSVGHATATTTIMNGFNSSISLSATGMPAGTTVGFNPSTIPAPGGGNSKMTFTVGASTPIGIYPITVTGNSGDAQSNATVNLIVISSVWQQGFDFRNSASFVTDPAGDTDVIPTTIYPTVGTLTTYGWSGSATFVTRDRDNTIDSRLAGVNFVTNGAPGAFYVDLPAPGTYNVSLAMGDAGNPACGTLCQVQFLDGGSVLATVTGGPTGLGYFYDAVGNNWSAAAWPTKNVSQQVTLVGTQLTVLVGTSQYSGDYTPLAYLGLTQVSTGPTFALQAPTSVSVGQGQYSTADVFTVLIGAFNSAINLSATGAPAGVTLSFNPSTMPAPGAGTSIMTINVPNGIPLGNYAITVTAKGGGIIQNATVVLTVTVADPPAFTLAAPISLGVSPGSRVTGTILTTTSDGFNNAISLSASGAPTGTTVNFSPSTIPAPGAGSSTMSINVPAGTAFGSYPIVVTGTSGQGNQTATVTLTVSASGNVNLPAGTGWLSLGRGGNFCNASPGHAYYNPQVGAVDAFDFLGACGLMVAYSGGAADTTNDRYFLWTSGHSNYQGNEMYELDLKGASPSVARITDPDWTVDNTDVPPDCACKGTKNCGQGMWHDGAGNPVSNPYSESGYGGPVFESIPAPDGSYGQPSCGYGASFAPNAREIYAGMVYNPPVNKLFAWGGVPAANPTGNARSNWTLDLNLSPAKWTRLKDSSSRWFTAAVYDYTTNRPTSGYDLVYDEYQKLYAYNPPTDSYTVLGSLEYIGYNVNVELDPIHHNLVMENGDNYGGYHLRIVNIDSCDGNSCKVTNLDNTASCQAALGFWAGLAWDSKRNVMSIFPSSQNCSGAGCVPPFNTVYLLNPDPNNPVTITYQGKPQTIQPQQCFAAKYGNKTPPQSLGPGVYSRFKYYPNEDIYLYIPFAGSTWILRLE